MYLYKVVSISKDIGKIIKSYLQSNSRSIYMTIYPLNVYQRLLSKNDTLIKIKVDIRSSQAYIEELAQYQIQLIEFGVRFQIYYQLDICYSCKKRHNFTQFERNCYANGKYCILPASQGVSGIDLLDQVIALNCLWEQSINKWWRFMMLRKDKCLESTNYLNCHAGIFDELDVDWIALQFCTKQDQMQLLESYTNYSQSNIIIDHNGTETSFDSDDFEINQICSYLQNAYQSTPQFCDIFIPGQLTLYYTPIVQACIVIIASIGIKLIMMISRKPEQVLDVENLEIK